MLVFFETHCHSYVSDGVGSPELLVKLAVRRGIKVLSLTDHDTFRGSVLASRVSQALGVDIIIVYGAEVLTSWGDILVYCSEPLREPLPRDPMVLRDLANDNNCVLIAPHPFQPLMPSVGLRIREQGFFDGVEVWNAKSPSMFNIPAIIYARRLGKPGLSGSDAHVPSALGLAPTKLNSDVVNVDDVLEAIRRGHVKPTISLPKLRSILEDIAWSLYRRV